MDKSGVYSATVVSRSVNVPSPADAITYGVAVRIDGQTVEFNGVKPQASARWSYYIPDDGEVVNLVPFEIGRIVTLHLFVQGTTKRMYIGDAEFPEFKGCE